MVKKRRSATAVDVSDPVPVPDVEMIVADSLKRTHDVFLLSYAKPSPMDDRSQRIRVESKVADEYDSVKHIPPPVPVAKPRAQRSSTAPASSTATATATTTRPRPGSSAPRVTDGDSDSDGDKGDNSVSATIAAVEATARDSKNKAKVTATERLAAGITDGTTRALALRPKRAWTEPEWHAPWKLSRVIAGHLQWVRALAVDVGNEWFASGAGDRTIKLWDLASGALKLTLTGHVSTVRGLAISDRHPYLYSVGEDKMVRCWDLETNKTIRSYHGHHSGVYACSLHPTLDVLVTGGRDSAVRVWDVRTKAQIHVMTGHSNTVASIATQAAEPQVISGSQDSTIRLWDLRTGRASSILTQHKKGVRALVLHPKEYSFASASPWTIKQWRCPQGDLMSTLRGHDAIINTMSLNRDNVLFSGGDDGTMAFWDWKTGYRFQSTATIAQPGSLDSEAGVFSSTFDRTGSRLITGEGDKTIKIWREDETATPESHPVKYKPDLGSSRW